MTYASAAAMAAIPRDKPARRRPRPVDDPARLPGLDLRTSNGRRFTAIARALVVEYPGGDVSRIRELAILKLSIELRQARLISTDDPAQSDELVRLSNLAARRERDLRLRRKPTKQPTFLERLVAEANGAPRT
jgi:hypothetical protein